jgi:hypothetical protein
MKCVCKFLVSFGEWMMYNSFAELENGNFFVVELNGAASEPTHIMIPRLSFLHGRN